MTVYLLQIWNNDSFHSTFFRKGKVEWQKSFAHLTQVRETLYRLNSDSISFINAKNDLEVLLKDTDGLTERAWTKVLDACMKWKLSDIGFQAFTLMSDANIPCNTHQLTWLLGKLCDDGRIIDARQALERSIALGLNPCVQHFSPLLRSCESIDQARELLQQMESLGIEPNVISYTAAIKSCEKIGDWKSALSLLDHMRASDIQANELTYCCIISSCSRGREGAVAVNILREMISFGLQPNIIHYASALTACARSEMWKEVDDLIVEMEHKGHKLAENVLISVINVCREVNLQNKHFQKSIPNTIISPSNLKSHDLLQHMRNSSSYSSSSFSQHSHSHSHSSSSISSSSSSSHSSASLLPWERAIHLLNTWGHRVTERSESLFTIVMDVCESCNRTEEVLEVYRSMKNVFNTTAGKSTFHFAMRACTVLLDPMLALSVLADAQEIGLDTPMIYNATMIICAATGRYDLAIGTLRSLLDNDSTSTSTIEDNSSTTSTSTNTTSIQRQQRLPPLWMIRRILQESLENLTRKFSSSYTEVTRGKLSPSIALRPYIEDITTLLRICIREKYVLLNANVYPIAVKLLLDVNDFNTLRILLKTTLYREEQQNVIDSIRLYEFAVKSITNYFPLRKSILHILELLLDVSNASVDGSKRASGLLVLSMSRIYNIRPFVQNATAVTNYEIASENGRRTLKNKKNRYIRGRIGYPRDFLVYNLFRKGRDILGIGDVSLRAFILAALACRRSGRADWMMDVYRSAVEEGITDPLLVFENHVVYTLSRSDDYWDTALDIFEGIKSQGRIPDTYLYTSALVACHKGADWERALCLLDSMREDRHPPNTFAYTTAISVCATCAQADHALTLLEKMDLEGLRPNIWAFNSAIAACAKCGRWKDALAVFEVMRGTDDNNNNNNNNKYDIHSHIEDGMADVDTSDNDTVDIDSYNNSGSGSTLPITTDNISSTSSSQTNSISINNTNTNMLASSSDNDNSSIDPARGKIRPNVITYNTLVEALGEGGQHFLIDDIYADALKKNIFHPVSYSANEGLLIDLHDHSVHLAKAAIRNIFERLHRRDSTLKYPLLSEHALLHFNNSSSSSHSNSNNNNNNMQQRNNNSDSSPNMCVDVTIITGKGFKLTNAILNQLIDDFRPAIRSSLHKTNSGRLVLSATDVQRWLHAHRKLR
eukprot:gene193-344_t